jgi:hypothetical protein
MVLFLTAVALSDSIPKVVCQQGWGGQNKKLWHDKAINNFKP